MWVYRQSTGLLSHNGQPFIVGYAGRGSGFNDPEMQNVSKIGPLPQGQYTIGLALQHAHLGSVVLALAPSKTNEMFGRDGFFIHGDNTQVNHTASEGCIVVTLTARIKINQAVIQGDNQLEVIA